MNDWLIAQRSLQLPPRSGAMITRIGDDRFREVLVRPYRIAYRVDADKVVVLTVKHYRQRLVEFPSDL